MPRLLLCRRPSLGTLGSADSQCETSLQQKRLSTVLYLALPFPSSRRSLRGISHRSRQNEKAVHKGLLFILVAEMGFEPHDLRVMSPTSYQTAPLRDIMVPEAGVEPVREKISRDFKSRASANSAIPAFCDLRFPHCLYIIALICVNVNTFFHFFKIFCFLS